MSLPDLNDLSILETAAYILFHVWNKCTPLAACLDALKADPILHDALKEAHVKRDYDGIRSWSKTQKSPTPPPTVDSQLSTVLATLTPSLTTLLATHLPLPFFRPSPALPQHIRDHITHLAIPTLHSHPSLLLHNLHRPPPPDLQTRLREIFIPQMHTFLINTSGSGKTRLLLTGLCAHWGIYLTSQIDTSHIGSADLQNALSVQVPTSPGWTGVLPKATSSRYEESLRRNREIAECAIKRVLLARLIVFKAFLETKPNTQHPSTLPPSPLLSPPHIPHTLPTHPTHPKRPILHPLLHTLTLLSSTHGLTLLLSGTGLSQSTLDTAISSAVLKPASYRFISTTGAFDSHHSQAAYLDAYFPKGYFDSNEGKRLKERCWYWLRGRHRFTAGYISEVIARGFDAPHSVLKGVGWEGGMERGEVGFEKLRNHPSMLQTIQTLTTHALLRPDDKMKLGEDEDKQHTPTRPSPFHIHLLLYLHLLLIKNKRNPLRTPRPPLRSTLDVPHNTPPHPLLGRRKTRPERGQKRMGSLPRLLVPPLFTSGKKGKKMKLKEVFDFHPGREVPPWAGEEAEVVSLFRSSEGERQKYTQQTCFIPPQVHQHTHSQVPPAHQATHSHSYNTAPPHRCIPTQRHGPRHPPRLRLSSGTHLWIALQANSAQVHKAQSPSRAMFSKAQYGALRRGILSLKDGSPFSPSSYPTLVERTWMR
ncbi:hypothetical protein BDQ17DRAFT_1425576 [Cyathus striatus]|nr:hypothetical protein BDQ17DRAFT_1425576 [Cyathus striatus]